jgi:SpoVK/Ycf46/Vps4 family AAA+-type ATPase
VPQELMSIAKYACDKKKVHFTEDAEKFMYEKLVEGYRTRDRSFGNARYVHSLVDTAKMNMGLRLMSGTNLAELSDDEMSTIKRPDVERIFNKDAAKKADIPVDEYLLRDSLAELNALTGLDSVKAEINELVKLVKFYREIGKDVMNSFSLHSIFYGNPGTGKTTVARILAKIFKALGILEKGHLIEVDRQKLVGKFIGETAQKTAEAVERSFGGVLFVDEAYALSQGSAGDYGKEAVETILKRMEDHRGEFIVIAAGYPDNMDDFLESNPGLKSRFDKTFNFEDYNPDQLMEICLGMFRAESLIPDSQAQSHLRNYLTSLHENKDKFFGNARSVRKVVEEAVKNQHLRLASMAKENRTTEHIGTVTFMDVEEFKAGADGMISKSQSKVGFKMGK